VTKSCDGCTQCCKSMGVAELKKRPGVWCTECNIGKSCKIYDTRPISCMDFECLWLTTQRTDVPLPDALRPDRCKVVIAPTTDPSVISVHVDAGYRDAWKRPDVYRLLGLMADTGVKVVIGWGADRLKKMMYRVSKGVIAFRTIQMSEANADGMQWFEGDDDEVLR